MKCGGMEETLSYLFGIAHCFADLILDRIEHPSNVVGILAQSLSRLLSGVCRGFRQRTRGAHGVSCDLCKKNEGVQNRTSEALECGFRW